MTLQDAANKFLIKGLDRSMLAKQEEAFYICMAFLVGVEKMDHQNRQQGSCSLKHLVENPTADCYNGYVYEGTFILAALASGFTMEQRGEGLHASFNMSHRSLRQRAKQFGHSGRAKAA